MAKFDQVSNLIRRRINNGDYALKNVPSERQLAQEVGVSYMTARRALQLLVDDGLLVRLPGGGLRVRPTLPGERAEKRWLQIAFLAPLVNSPEVERWRLTLDNVVQDRGRVRPLLFRHWDDPLIGDALTGFDGIFLIPTCEVIPAHLLERFSRREKPLIALDQDMTHLGIPSVRLFSPVFVQRLLDHLAERGHTRIACLNSQPTDAVIEQRIAQWKIWMAAHGYAGPFIQETIPAYASAYAGGYNAMKRTLAEGDFEATALFCTTAAGAVGAMRALTETGRIPGKDIAVCAVNGEGYSEFLTPSLTALEAPETTPYLHTCVDWIAEGGRNWIGPLLVEPAEGTVVVRETTDFYVSKEKR
jgi:DNA-binding transcriptional regulator YhcF (GntR family)